MTPRDKAQAARREIDRFNERNSRPIVDIEFMRGDKFKLLLPTAEHKSPMIQHVDEQLKAMKSLVPVREDAEWGNEFNSVEFCKLHQTTTDRWRQLFLSEGDYVPPVLPKLSFSGQPTEWSVNRTQMKSSVAGTIRMMERVQEMLPIAAVKGTSPPPKPTKKPMGF